MSELLAAGAMIGTSLDGLDVALVAFSPDLRHARLVVHRTDALRHADPGRLRAIASGAATTAEEVSALRFALVDDHERSIRAACTDAQVDPARLEWVAAHGVTLWHAPAERGGHGWQPFAGPALAARLGCPVVHDLRGADLALGGHGAPLAPVADLRLRAAADEDRVILNLGGIANLTAIGAGGATVVAADVGPANLPLDELVRRHGDGGVGYDADGRLATRGRVDPGLHEWIVAQDWFRAPVPRSWGREEFGPTWVDALEATAPRLGLADRLATVIAAEIDAIAWTLEHALGDWRRAETLRVLVTGGGRHNRHAMERMRQALAPAWVDGIEAVGEHADAKEAVDFALLGGLCLRREAAGAHRTTGARADAVLGSVAWGRPGSPDVV